MNIVRKYLNSENRRQILNLVRPSQYNFQPVLKLNPEATRWQRLLAMRDLRLWIAENTPFSSRNHQYQVEVEQILNELNYMQHRSFMKAGLLWMAFFIGFIMFGPQYTMGDLDMYSRPNIIGETSGFSVLHDGCIPKLNNADLTDINGI